MHQEIFKEKIKENYGKIALKGNLDSCCGPQEICETNNISKEQMLSIIGYNNNELNQFLRSQFLDWDVVHH
ncbi:MAG: hypothetical protein ACR2F1_01525 [Nitrososphaeraceae archaeon]